MNVVRREQTFVVVTLITLPGYSRVKEFGEDHYFIILLIHFITLETKTMAERSGSIIGFSFRTISL